MGLNKALQRKAGLFVALSCILVSFCSCDQKSAEVIPTGTLAEVMTNEASFYALRGGSDYSRAPVRYPFHLLNVTGAPTLNEGRFILVENIKTINVQTNFILGTYGPYESFGQTNPGGWFVFDVTTHTNRTVPTAAMFREISEQLGLSNQVLLPVGPLIEEFMFRGVLPFGK